MTVTNITPPESIANDDLGFKSKEFFEACEKLNINNSLHGDVSVFIKATADDNGRPLIHGYAVSIGHKALESATPTGDPIAYLITARNRLRLFKTLDAVASYLGSNGVYAFTTYTAL